MNYNGWWGRGAELRTKRLTVAARADPVGGMWILSDAGSEAQPAAQRRLQAFRIRRVLQGRVHSVKARDCHLLEEFEEVERKGLISHRLGIVAPA